MICPKCDSTRVVRNGRNRPARQRYKCLECGRTFNNDAWEMATSIVEYISDRFLLESPGSDYLDGITNDIANIISRFEPSKAALAASNDISDTEAPF